MKPYQNPICLFAAFSAEDLIRTSGLTNTSLKSAGSEDLKNIKGYTFSDFLNPKS